MATSWSAWLRRKFSFLGRRAKRRPFRKTQSARLRLEQLEDRCLLASLQVGPNINLSHLAGDQRESTTAINPNDPSQVFVASNSLPPGNGLFAAYKGAAGDWVNKPLMATGTDGLPTAWSDPQATFDRFGNLFLTYLDA
jgi:hypothetical protein